MRYLSSSSLPILPSRPFFPAAASFLLFALAAFGCYSSRAQQTSDSSQTCPSSELSGSPCEQSNSALLSNELDPAQRKALPTGRESEPDSGVEANSQLRTPPNYSDNALPASRRNELQQRKPRPIELTEFQRFITASTGTLLPVYGASIFEERSHQALADTHIAATDNFVLSADDELRIHLWGQINFSATLHVSREGEIFLPKIGAIHLAGLRFPDARTQIQQSVAKVYKNFELSVDLGAAHSIQIYLAGQAREPGQHTVSGISSLVDALFLTSGPTSAGSMRHMQLLRDGKLVRDFDLYALLLKGDKSADAPLKAGDVLYYPPSGNQVAILGSVQIPAIYELRDNDTIADLLQLAGGKTPSANTAHATLERIDNEGHRSAFSMALNGDGLATTLRNGDLLRIESILSSYSATVTLRGSVAMPGHFRWHAGMHLSELMPEREALESRDYWWHRTELGLPAPEFVDPISQFTTLHAPLPAARQIQLPNHNNDSQQNTNAPQANDDARSAQTGTISSASGKEKSPTDQQNYVNKPRFETNWNYAVIERLDPTTMRTSLIPFEPGRLVLLHDPGADIELVEGDVITIFSQDDLALPSTEQTKYIRLEGEFAHAGIYSVAPGETLRSLVARAGGLTTNAYLYGSEFTRKSTRQIEQQRLDDYTERLEQEMRHNALSNASQSAASPLSASAGEGANLNRELLDRMRQLKATGRIVLAMRPQSSGAEALPDLPLEDGDRLIVPARPATVQVVGAVMNQNAFLYKSTARFADYLREAGGPNREADKSRIFILHADGSVTRSTPGQSIFAASMTAQRLNPGDTIIVPEKLWHPSALNSVMNYVQLFSQLTLSAAALNAIK